MASKKKLEDYMQELSEVVTQLENKDNSLDDAMAYFEKGVGLTKTCQQLLDKAQQKVDILLEDKATGEVVQEPFAPEEE